MLSKEDGKLFFQRSAQVYSLPGQTEGKERLFLEKTSIDLSSKLSLTYETKLNHCESAHYPLSTVSAGIGNTLAAFKTNK